MSAWIKAQADYRAGESLVGICKKYKVTMGALLKRIKAEGWTRAGQKPSGKAVSEAVEGINSRVDEALDEALADIIHGHQAISRQQREELDSLLAEYQELKMYFVSALDKDTIEELVRQCPSGQPNEKLIKHLYSCLEAFSKRVNINDRLVRLAGFLIETERKVWAIDKHAEGAEAQSYDDLLEEVERPLVARSLPPGVVDFEAKIAKKREVKP